MWFPERFEKKIFGSIYFIPGIYPNGVSLMTPINFRVPGVNFGPLVATYLPKRLSGTFWKKQPPPKKNKKKQNKKNNNIGLNSLHTQ